MANAAVFPVAAGHATRVNSADPCGRIAAIAIAACYVPARRAISLDAVLALHES